VPYKKGNHMSKTALIPIADGSEEIEAVTIIDVLRRAEISVTVASVSDDGALQITGSHGIQMVADCAIDDCQMRVFDLIAIPGGLPGAEHIAASAPLDKLLRKQAENQRLYGAICAAPQLVLESKGLLNKKIATGHPMFQLLPQAREVDSESRVVVDGNCVSSQGPGTALDFSLELVERLCGLVKREEVASGLVLTTSPAAYY
jgi:4-methyl-5(b-hydroxyethyl)-thiazole monophosphate biosynthesis